MALNLESLSITSVFNSIVNFFRSNENQTRWKNLSTGSEGSFLIRLLSNVFSAISYRVVAQSRENFLSTAALPSSNTGIAVNLGYSVYRGSNLKRKVRLRSNGDYTIPRLSEIGNYEDGYSICALGKYDSDGTLYEGDFSLEEDEVADILVVVGNVKEQTVIASTSAVRVFSLFTTGISEDFTLYLDSQEVPVTSNIKELAYDKYLVRTNPYGSVDIMYLNTFPNFLYKYNTDSQITIRYVELADVGLKAFNNSMFETFGELLDFTTVSKYIPYETVEEIKVNAPLHHELQNLIRSKADYSSRLAEIVPSIQETNFEPLTPTYTLVSYLKDDLTLITDSERAKVNSLLLQENFFGTPLPDITHPRRAVAKLNIYLDLKDKFKNISDIQLDINNILANYYDITLGLKFSVYDLERQLEGLSYVRYARVSQALNDRTANTNYQLGYILYIDDKYYKVAQILGYSGTLEPTWNVPPSTFREIDSGLETIDGGLVWRTFKYLPNMPHNSVSVWKPEEQYGIGEYVTSVRYVDDVTKTPLYMFKCVDLLKNTGSTDNSKLTYIKGGQEYPISTASVGDFIIDGSIVWVAKEYSDAPTRVSLSNVRLGESRNVPSNSKITLECISYTGTVGTEETIEFEEYSYPIEAVTATTFTIDGDKTYYFRNGDVIVAAHAGGTTTFSIYSSVYDGTTGKTVITVHQNIDATLNYTTLFTEERGTRDGQILWKLVEDPSTFKCDWNMYMTFDYDLDIPGND